MVVSYVMIQRKPSRESLWAHSANIWVFSSTELFRVFAANVHRKCASFFWFTHPRAKRALEILWYHKRGVRNFSVIIIVGNYMRGHCVLWRFYGSIQYWKKGINFLIRTKNHDCCLRLISRSKSALVKTYPQCCNTCLILGLTVSSFHLAFFLRICVTRNRINLPLGPARPFHRCICLWSSSPLFPW